MDPAFMFDGLGSSVIAAIAGALVSALVSVPSATRLGRDPSSSLRKPVKALSRYRLVS